MTYDSSIVLSVAELSDMPAIHRVFRESITGVNAGDYTPEQIRVWLDAMNDSERWHRKLGEQYFIVARINGDVSGFASLENENYVDMMYVHPRYLRMGVGGVMLTRLEEVAKASATTTITADVSITAVPFFTTKGFSIEHRNQRIIKGVEIVNYRMTKSLRV